MDPWDSNKEPKVCVIREEKEREVERVLKNNHNG